jgi:phosphomannomutase
MTLIKSISGIRGIVNTSLNSKLIVKYVSAFSNISPSGKLLLARDTRNSGAEYINSATTFLEYLNRESINCDIIPTPTAQFLIKRNNYAGGIVFTASHNPSNWNGMKFIDQNGLFIDQEKFDQLENEFKKIILRNDIESSLVTNKEENKAEESINLHLENILNLSIINKKLIQQQKYKVVIDCANGAASTALPKLLKKLNCEVIKINSDYNEDFGRSPEPIPSNIKDLASFVTKNNADIGFATDPDGDRLSIVDNLGNPLGEEMTLAFCVYYFLKFFEDNRKYPIVANLSTSMVSEKISELFVTPFIISAVGEINVVKKMQCENSLIGGEGNGGIILRESHLGRDSLVGTIIVLNLLAKESKTINEIFNSLPKFYIQKTSLELKNDSDATISKLKKYFINENIIETDGLKIIRKNEWIHIRKSNTEPILRIIAESESISRSKELINMIKNEIY